MRYRCAGCRLERRTQMYADEAAGTRKPIARDFNRDQTEQRSFRSWWAGPISTPRLNVLPRLHLAPINLIISQGSRNEC